MFATSKKGRSTHLLSFLGRTLVRVERRGVPHMILISMGLIQFDSSGSNRSLYRLEIVLRPTDGKCVLVASDLAQGDLLEVGKRLGFQEEVQECRCVQREEVDRDRLERRGRCARKSTPAKSALTSHGSSVLSSSIFS